MSSPEFDSIDYTFQESQKAARVVKEALNPLVDFAKEILVIKLVRAVQGYDRLSSFILPFVGRAYGDARAREEKRMKRGFSLTNGI